MKRYKQWPLILSALLLTALGAAMPRAVSTIQDRTVESETEIRPFDPVDLKLMKGEGVQKVLQLLEGPVEEMEWPGKTQLTEEDAGEAVRDVLMQMDRSGLIDPPPENFAELEIFSYPNLFMSTDDSNVSAVVWACGLGDSLDNWFYIDDETGKMVRMMMSGTSVLVLDTLVPALKETVNVSILDRENSVRRLDQWRQFLSDYYMMELEFSDIGEFDEGFGIYGWMTFDAGGYAGTVYLELQEGDIYFNF